MAKRIFLPSLPDEVSEEPTATTLGDIAIFEGKARIRGMLLDQEQRLEYARKAYELVVAWVGGIILLLTLSGIKLAHFKFELSENVLLALIGGTTLNVLGVFYFVMAYLFHVDDKKIPIPPRL